MLGQAKKSLSVSKKDVGVPAVQQVLHNWIQSASPQKNVLLLLGPMKEADLPDKGNLT